MRAEQLAELAGQAGLGALHGQNLGLARQLARQQALLVLQLLGEQRQRCSVVDCACAA